MTRRSLPGMFTADRLSPRCWQLTADSPHNARVYLNGAGPDAAKVLEETRITALEFEWCTDGVTVGVIGQQGVRCFKSESVLIHEPKEHLYDHLPLASFDGAARRFWKRVFRLMRVPGGRLLLGVIARRRRASGTTSH